MVLGVKYNEEERVEEKEKQQQLAAGRDMRKEGGERRMEERV